jgi:hypothetical protein
MHSKFSHHLSEDLSEIPHTVAGLITAYIAPDQTPGLLFVFPVTILMLGTSWRSHAFLLPHVALEFETYTLKVSLTV